MSTKSAGDISDTLHMVVKGRGDEDVNIGTRGLTTFDSDSPDDNLGKIFEVRVRFAVVVVVPN